MIRLTFLWIKDFVWITESCSAKLTEVNLCISKSALLHSAHRVAVTLLVGSDPCAQVTTSNLMSSSSSTVTWTTFLSPLILQIYLSPHSPALNMLLDFTLTALSSSTEQPAQLVHTISICCYWRLTPCVHRLTLWHWDLETPEIDQFTGICCIYLLLARSTVIAHPKSSLNAMACKARINKS